jgi:hypothetical protein
MHTRVCHRLTKGKKGASLWNTPRNLLNALTHQLDHATRT